MFFSLYIFSWQTQKIKNNSPLSLEEKELLARFSVKFVMLPGWSIALANQFTYVTACTNADFIGKPALCAFFGIHNPGKFVRYKLLIPKTIQLTYKTFVPNPIKRFWHIQKFGKSFQREIVITIFYDFVLYR